jgi:hypothetical protein
MSFGSKGRAHKINLLSAALHSTQRQFGWEIAPWFGELDRMSRATMTV